MTKEEMLDDLEERCDRAMAALSRIVDDGHASQGDRLRLVGKVQGVGVMKDWLRAYRCDR